MATSCFRSSCISRPSTLPIVRKFIMSILMSMVILSLSQALGSSVSSFGSSLAHHKVPGSLALPYATIAGPLTSHLSPMPLMPDADDDGEQQQPPLFIPILSQLLQAEHQQHVTAMPPVATAAAAAVGSSSSSSTVFNAKASRSSCVDGLPSFEVVTGFAYPGSKSSDAIKTIPDVMNLQDCLSQCLRVRECRSVNFETGLCVLLNSHANYSAHSTDHPSREPSHSPSPSTPHFPADYTSTASSPSPTSSTFSFTPSESSAGTLFPSSPSFPVMSTLTQGLKVSQYPVFTIYAEKICIEGSRAKSSCSGRSWTFERVIGFMMNESMAKKRAHVMSRMSCMEVCLNESSFECRSVNFNRASGECSLFDVDRQGISSGQVVKRGMLMKQKRVDHEINFDHNFLPSHPHPIDYLENNCIKDPQECTFAPIKNLILKTVDSVHENVRSVDACRIKCLNAPYRCFSFDFGADSEPKVGGICRTSHLNTGSVLTIEQPFAEMPGAVTYQLISCMNVTIHCSAQEMTAVIRTNRLFDGKIYARSRPNSCKNDISNSMEFSLSLPYNDVMCDVRQEGSGNMFKSDLVIQHHDLIVTAADFGFSVLCKYDMKNRTITNSNPLVIDGSPVYENEGRNGVIEASNINWPNVTMNVLDMEEKAITSAQVGETLSLVFDILDTNSPYEIFVRDLVAVDGIDTNEILLIDSFGCPTEMAIMTSISKFTKSSKKLRTTFEAFKFPSSDVVQFRALITPCLSSCKPVQCSLLNTETGINQEFVSYGRRKRNADEDPDPQSSRSSLTSSSSPSAAAAASHGTMYESPDDEKQAKSSTSRIRTSSSSSSASDSSPDVVVVGAIRITENFAAFESSSREEGERSSSSSSTRGGGGGAETGNYSQLSSLSGSDVHSANSRMIGGRNEGSSGSHNSNDCSNMIGLIIACVIFLTGQLILLMAWIYMYRMSSVYRSKFFAASFPSASSPSMDSSSSSSSMTIVTKNPLRHQASTRRMELPSSSSAAVGKKSFPCGYSFPFASSPDAQPGPSNPSSGSMCNSQLRASTTAKTIRSSSPVSSSPADAAHAAAAAASTHKVAAYLSKRSFHHP